MFNQATLMGRITHDLELKDVYKRQGLKIMDMLEKHGKYRKINLYGKTRNVKSVSYTHLGAAFQPQ